VATQKITPRVALGLSIAKRDTISANSCKVNFNYCCNKEAKGTFYNIYPIIHDTRHSNVLFDNQLTAVSFLRLTL